MSPPTILFDGDCGLCQHSVQFILRHEKGERLHFAPQASPRGQQLLAAFGQPPVPETLVLVQGDRISTQSTAALRASAYLKAPYSFLQVFRLIPSCFSDRVYRLVATHRRRISCIPNFAIDPSRFQTEAQ